MQNWDGHDFTATGKLDLHLILAAQRFIICTMILGGAALQRYANRVVLNAGLPALPVV
jgi:hypothetical protein